MPYWLVEHMSTLSPYWTTQESPVNKYLHMGEHRKGK